MEVGAMYLDFLSGIFRKTAGDTLDKTGLYDDISSGGKMLESKVLIDGCSIVFFRPILLNTLDLSSLSLV